MSERIEQTGPIRKTGLTPGLPYDKLAELPEHEKLKTIEVSALEIINTLKRSGATEFTDVRKMYAALGNTNLIVRREAPERIVESIELDLPIQITFPDGERYSNAVEWQPNLGSQGLNNAYLEGYSHLNGVVTVFGFKTDNQVDVQSLPDASQRFAGLPREYVRSVKGTVHKDAIVFVSVRIPFLSFPSSQMTPEELDLLELIQSGEEKKPQFIHRGYLMQGGTQTH